MPKNRKKKKQHSKQRGQSPTSTQKSYTNPIATTSDDLAVARMTFIVPLALSGILWFVDCVVAINQYAIPVISTLKFWIDFTPTLIDTFIGYFPATLISMILAAILQQDHFHIPSGLGEPKVVALTLALIAYLAVYASYLSQRHTNPDLQRGVILVATVAFCVVVWRSLTKDMKAATRKQADTFSAP